MRVPFSLNLQAIDTDKDGLLEQGDKIDGHLSLQPPKGAPIKRINANVLYGGVCAGDDPSCYGLFLLGGRICLQNPEQPVCNAIPLFTSLANGPAVQDYIRLHPREGSTVLLGFYRASAKNPDDCAPKDVDCIPYVALAFDLDNSNGPSLKDGVFFVSQFGPQFAGFVEKGNLSITSATVPAN